MCVGFVCVGFVCVAVGVRLGLCASGWDGSQWRVGQRVDPRAPLVLGPKRSCFPRRLDLQKVFGQHPVNKRTMGLMLSLPAWMMVNVMDLWRNAETMSHM